MRNLFNTFTSSFIKTLARIICYLLIGFLLALLYSDKVHAVAVDDWFEYNSDIVPSPYVFMYDITFSGYSQIANTQDYITYQNGDYEIKPVVYNTNNATIGTNGIAFVFHAGTKLKADYLYSVTTYICSPAGLPESYDLNHNELYSNALSGTLKFYSKTRVSMSHNYAKYNKVHMSSCQAYGALFVPTVQGSYISIKMMSSPSITGKFYFMGFTLEELGIYKDSLVNDIRSIISTSGYATASSVQQVQNSVNQVKTEVNGLNATQQQTNNLISGESEDTESSSCGVICKMKGIFRGIIELPGKLVTLLIDALKSLFVPTDEQLYEVINDASELSENFGFVGESVAFFINIFTSLLGLVNGNGCINLPAFSIGATSLTPALNFWNAQNVCLNENTILSSNITTIRTITSIALVCMFLGFASRKFFKILSKTDDNEEGDN